MGPQASLCLNGNLDFKGESLVLAGRDYKAYGPFDDAPEEGEFDWDGFMTNLAMGLAATAVLAGLAAFTIATGGAGGVLASALVGAAIGTLTSAISGAIGELKSGNVRSTKEVIRDLAVSGISGAITGGAGAKIPEVQGPLKYIVDGVIDTGAGVLERGLLALTDKDMSWEEKWKYTFDPKQMGIDFAAGMVTGYTVDKIGKRGKGGGKKKGVDDADGLETTKEKGKKKKGDQPEGKSAKPENNKTNQGGDSEGGKKSKKDGDKKKQKEKKPEDKKPKNKNESQGGTPPEKEPSNTSGRSTATTIDYSYKFDRELANFNDGYEIRTTVDKDLILVQYSSDAPDASLCYWTTVDEANGITTLNDYMDKLAISKDWGNRNTVKVARIPAGTEVKYAVGTAREQLLIADPRPGGGVQYLFNQFDTNWITEIRSFPN